MAGAAAGRGKGEGEVMGPWRAMLGRELLESSRRTRTWTLRWVAATAATAVAVLAVWVMGAMNGAGAMVGPGTLGRVVFTAVGVLTGGWALFVGCQKTADSLGKERRDGTLGLLFLTDMKGWDVVLGKLAGAGTELFLQLASVVPVLMVPMLLGGVSAVQVGWLVASLAGALVMSLASGLLASLVARDPRQATGIAVAWLLGLLLVPLALVLLLVSLERRVPEDVAKWASLPSPAVPFMAAFMPGLAPEWPLALGALALQGMMSWLVLGWTSRWVRTAWQEGGARTWRARWIEWVNRVRFGGPEARARWRRRWLGEGAWEWLSLRERWKPAMPWALVVVAYGLWVANVVQLGWRDVAATGTGVLTVLFHGLFALWVAGEAGITLHEQRVAGAMELLLTSGLTASDILRGQGRVLRRMLMAPVLAVTALDVVVVAWVPFMDVSWGHVAVGWWVHLACMALTPTTWLGMRWATTLAVMEGRPINVAVGRALGRCVAWPAMGVAAGGGMCWFWASMGQLEATDATPGLVAGACLVTMGAWQGVGARRWRLAAEGVFRARMSGERQGLGSPMAALRRA